jgi:hypothetical protein
VGRLLGLNAYLECLHRVVLHSLQCASIGVACLIPAIDHIRSPAEFAASFVSTFRVQRGDPKQESCRSRT